MWKKWAIIAVSAVLLLICYEWSHRLHAELMSAAFKNPGTTPELTLPGQFQSLIASVGGIGGLIGIVFGLLHQFTDSLPPGAEKTALIAAFSAGKQQILSKIYLESKDIAFRKAMRDAAAADNQLTFNNNFPIDPKIDASTTDQATAAQLASQLRNIQSLTTS